ncbi:MAG: Erg28 like protein-domain-containing protein [Lentinula lateritia]|uniref:Erg28 like protein-domain-containing protein n=1 Tax=Lentinula lateritia TaxID=40482 RepID=A0ABQ8VWK1_9AGAR|nr:MAG: Erg28 like protein-domain-containing protein [Lentinula lateritia]KAJ4500701.1 Erg28 like protein-domain-containing protein [Lentinula lateritia]
MDVFKSFLPTSEGWLPIWQLVVASAAVFNAIQNYTTLKLTQRLYARMPHLVNPLQARAFGTWTITSAVIRGYAAYHIHEKTSASTSHTYYPSHPAAFDLLRIYDICIISYLIAFSHFTSELLIFKTAKLNGPVVSPFIVASVSLAWMILQYDFYVS